MNVELAEELLNELGTSLENLETQHAALLQFLKDTGIVKEEQFAPYLTQAAKASSVRWRAARVRLDSLLSREREQEEQRAAKEKSQAKTAEAPAPDQKPEQKDTNEQNEKDRNEQESDKSDKGNKHD